MITVNKIAICILSLGLVACAADLQANAALSAAPTQETSADVSTMESVSPVMEKGLELVEERCAACHAPDLIFAQRKSSDQWAVTVYDMVDRGAVLSPEETETVIQYLEQTYPLESATPQ